jgi:hypothetical protein
MKYYSIDSNARKTTLVVLLFISFFLAKLINDLLSVYSTNISTNLQAILSALDFWGVSITSVTLLGVFGILYFLYSKWLWKAPIISRLHRIPNLNGVWKGELTSSFKTNGEATKISISMEIIQDWDNMRVKCTFPKSSSHSIAAFVFSNGDSGIEFGFPYCNDSHCVEWKTKKHDGYNTFNVAGKSMIGRYFTNREDGTNGIIVLEKKARTMPRRKR